MGQKRKGGWEGQAPNWPQSSVQSHVNVDQQSRDQTDQIENEDDVDRMDEDMYVYTSQPENINVEQQPNGKTSWPKAFYLTRFYLIIYIDKHNTNYKNTHGCNISTYLVNCHISNLGEFVETLKAVQTDPNKEFVVFVVTSKHKFSSKRNISIILKPLNYVMQPIGPSAQNPYSK